MEKHAVEWTEWIVHRIFFWEDDNKKKGKILRALHHAASYSLATMILVSHVVYPAFWLQTILLGIVGIVWVHHVLTHGCVVSKVEQKLLEDETSFLDPYLEILGIEVNERSKQGILILGSTVLVSVLSLEWVSRVSHKVIPLLRSQIPAVSPVLHTLAQ